MKIKEINDDDDDGKIHLKKKAKQNLSITVFDKYSPMLIVVSAL